MTSYDSRVWTIAVVAQLGVATVAAVVPARRAARVNPVSAISDRR